MKNLALTLAMAVLLAACSSGSTVSPLPSTTNSQFSGTYQNLNNTQSGTVRMDLVETDGDGTSAVSGNIIFTANGNNCLNNGQVTGTSNGFNISLTAPITRDEYTITTTVTRSDNSASVSVRTSSSGTVGEVSRVNANGDSETVVTSVSSLSGNINIQLAISNNGNTLSGTYTTDGNVCSNQTGTGDMTLNRI